MDYRRLGKSGLQVSAVGLGTNNFGGRCDVEQTALVVRQALDSGVTFLDTADQYSTGVSEEFIGMALRGRRKEATIATKVGQPFGPGPLDRGASRQHIMEQAEGSLRRLGTDYIDLYYIHVPDPNTPIEETLRALDDLVHQGKVRYIGCSNFTPWQVCEAVWTSRLMNLASFVVTQNQYSLVNRSFEREMAAFCQQYGIGLIPYSPLASGLLTGKYRAGETLPADSRFATNPRWRNAFYSERNLALASRLEPFARERGHTLGELAIAWLLANPLVGSVIAGATSPEQVVENARAADWKLTPQDMAGIRAILDEAR